MALPITKRQVISSLIEDGLPPSTFPKNLGRPRREMFEDLDDTPPPQPQPQPTIAPQPTAAPEVPAIKPQPIAQPREQSSSDVSVLSATPIRVPPPPAPAPVEEEDEELVSRPPIRARRAAEQFESRMRDKKSKLPPLYEEDEPTEEAEEQPSWFEKLKSNKLVWVAGAVGLFLLTGGRGGQQAAPKPPASTLWE